MLSIHSDELEVTLLHPADDRSRMGTRYCTGGYIFQVTDPRVGPLMSGPTYPDSFNWFDGQGIPDAFNLSPLRSLASPDPTALVIGIGVCDTEGKRVLEFCEWEIDAGERAVAFTTRQERNDFALELVRDVSVSGRTIVSRTRLANVGRSQIPMRWFPHPFYPIPEGPALCSLCEPVSLPPGTTYSVRPDGYLECADLAALQSVAVRTPGRSPISFLERHPLLGLVGARYSFPAPHVLVWGNPNTFSFEPYLDQTVGVGSGVDFTAEYHF